MSAAADSGAADGNAVAALLPMDRLPLGFRFHPTDQELINHYLKRKITGKINTDTVSVIPEVDVCKSEPWDLPDKSVIQSEDPEWFFFAPRDRKHANSARHNRATEAGYWKATGKDRTIKMRGNRGAAVMVIGMKKTLVFHQGRAPRGSRTNWIMHEYRTVEPEFENGEQGQFVLCRLFRKLEDNSPSTNVDEVESGGFSSTLTTSSPSDTHGADASGDSGTLLKQRPPESNLQQPAGCRRLVDDETDCSTEYTPKPEESDGISCVINHMGAESGFLQDALPQSARRYCFNDGPHVTSPQLMLGTDFPVDYFNQGSSMGLLQDNEAELDLFMESLLNNEEEDLFNIPNDLVGSSLAAYQTYPVSPNLPLDSELYHLCGAGNDVDSKPVLAQEGSHPRGSEIVHHPLLFASNQGVSTSDNHHERFVQNNPMCETSHRASVGQSDSWVGQSGNDSERWQSFDRNLESNILVDPSVNGIRIRHRQHHLSSNNPDVQGSANRRIRLQSYKNEEPATVTMSGNNKTDHVKVIKEEGQEYSEHQNGKEGKVPVGDHMFQGLVDHDKSLPIEVDHIPAIQPESPVRLGNKISNNTANGNEMDGKALYPWRPRQCSTSVIRLTPLLVFLLLLCAGIWFYVYL